MQAPGASQFGGGRDRRRGHHGRAASWSLLLLLLGYVSGKRGRKAVVALVVGGVAVVAYCVVWCGRRGPQ